MRREKSFYHVDTADDDQVCSTGTFIKRKTSKKKPKKGKSGTSRKKPSKSKKK